MSERVFAWTFDPEAFHRWLVPRVIDGSDLKAEALRATAAEVFFGGDVAVEYLEALRFFRDDAESWESTLLLDPDVDARDEQYAIAMARHLHPASDISTWSHQVALGALRHLAWNGDPHFFWWGNGLGTLAAESGNAALTQALATARRSLGGWLRVEEARVQLAALDAVRSQDLPDEVTLWFKDTIWGTLTPSELTDRVMLALSEFSAVMTAAVDRGEALRLVLWD
ncbi:hypothetical protein AVDCRST_MAG82-1005 [uncultured Rubrobacteraceae bacterium]|uniref:Uncharacterized protein n=1 Tax=uncultured Rubrobacteraceae bacterium TaxID=349277 RepID=A0A6J4PFN9_9ACTN|nr:hypothetical protein AVDCRST_MAG82-1005 [uncultured Rubrobacteraceae bacterium]